MARHRQGVCMAAFLLAAAPAQAAERHMVNVPAGRLAEAVMALGRQTGTSIGMSDQSLAALPVKPLKGRMSVERAIHRMLDDGKARAIRIDGRTWRIVRAAEAPRRILASYTPPSAAPDPAPVEDIIVTASKRDIPLLQYAGTVEVVDGGVFRNGEAAGGSVTLLNRVSSLSSTHAGPGRNKLFIRAIADSGIAGPSQATTGQYLGDMRLNYAAPDPDLRLYDIGAVEVLEGPQGTLYGAGSLGGIVRLVPNPPNLGRAGGQVSAGVTATRHGDPGGDLAATLNFPLVPERLALRVVAYGVTEGGYIDDSLRGLSDINRTHVAGGRVALRYAPDDTWTVDISGIYQRIEGDDAQYATRRRGLSRESNVDQNYFSDYRLANARVERSWGDISLVSTTGYVRHRLSERYDATGATFAPAFPVFSSAERTIPVQFHQRNRVSLFSTENRLSRDLHDGLGWLIGFSYINSRSTIRRTLGAVGTPLPATGVRNRLSEWTVFGEASVEPLSGLILTGGGRLTRSRLSGEALDPVFTLSLTDIARAEAQADRTETIFLPSVGLLTDAVPGVALFLRYQQGFRPGGLAVDDYRVQRFRNDRIATLEAGIRRGLPGLDTIAGSASFAYTKWKNIQADLVDRQGLPTTANIGDGRIYTLEGRISWRPMRHLSIDGSIIYNDSRLDQPTAFIRSLSLANRSLSLPNVANLGGRIGIDYRKPLSNGGVLRLSGAARYVGRSRLGVGPVFGGKQGDYLDTSLSGSWSMGPLELSLGVTNLLDSIGDRFALGTPFDLRGDHYTPMRPRTVRLGATYFF